MMKNVIFFCCFLLVACKSLKTVTTQEQNQAYQYQVDLLHVKNDVIQVRLIAPKMNKNNLVFVIPKIVPGIYGAMDFGQYVKNLKATDSKGNLLKTTKFDENSWQINNATHLYSITYEVEDTWDSLSYKDGFYRSAGSSYDAKEAFVLNYNTFIGYFEGFEKSSFDIQFIKPKHFYGASYLSPKPLSDTLEQVTAPNYQELVDAPLLYSEPDTAWLQVANTKVLVALYATPKQRYAKPLAQYLEKILTYQKDYLGGKLPVDKYVFLVYHSKNENPKSFLADGLEHAHSTICLYNSYDLTQLDGIIGDVASHEFFHVLTPLNIHSEEIERYNFRNPSFSKHLWLYEGMTEYLTFHAPIWQKYSSESRFFEKIEDKLKQSKEFDPNVSLTDMSKNTMEHQDQYYNFYLKGMLFNLCLDIELRSLSNGKTGVKDLMLQLMQRYGLNKSFKDDELFDTITTLTDPSIRDFFRKYVENTTPLPLKAQFEKVGIEMNSTQTKIRKKENRSASQEKLYKNWIGE